MDATAQAKQTVNDKVEQVKDNAAATATADVHVRQAGDDALNSVKNAGEDVQAAVGVKCVCKQRFKVLLVEEERERERERVR